ncbi:MAG: tetratricopeptide repeat protein [Pirellula sp.]
MYLAAWKLDLALPLHEKTLKLRKAKFGPDYPDTLTSMNDLTELYWRQGKRDKYELRASAPLPSSVVPQAIVRRSR